MRPRSTSTRRSQYGGAAGFAPGSTFKPFTLLEWLRKGHALNETVNGSRLQRTT